MCSVFVLQYINAVAKSWSESPYMFIVKFETLQKPEASRGRRETEDGDAIGDPKDHLSITSKVHFKPFYSNSS